MNCCEHGNEHSAYVKGKELLGRLSNYQVLQFGWRNSHANYIIQEFKLFVNY